MSAIRLVIFGASGRMGQALLRLAQIRPDLRVVAAVSRQPRSIADHPAFPLEDLNALPDFDVAIDFSLPEGATRVLDFCQQRRRALVSGTTGLSPVQHQHLLKAADSIPICWSANYSLGVAVLKRLSAEAAKALGEWSVDIFEAHHVHKKDAPSGTALALGEAVTAHHPGPLHYQSQRAGDIVGEHTVQFAGPGERIELVHRATNRDIFAAGALTAAARLLDRPAALYRFEDLIFRG